jgi:hypothetical protein
LSEQPQAELSQTFAMRYVALIENREVEFADESAVAESFQRGELDETTWIKIEDGESGWETVGEMFPKLGQGGEK